MRCDRSRPLLPLLADHALGPVRRWIVARHVAHCPDCAARLEEVLAMQTALRTTLPFHRAPPGLAARIGSALPAEAPPVASRGRVRRVGLGFAGSGLAGALAGVALTLLLLGRPGGAHDAVVASAVDAQIRSMMADHLTDVVTSDRHTVKPWLSARVDVSPPVRDLAAQGFPLIGGRLDYVDGHRAAAVVYRHAKHVINLFAWASPGAADSGFRYAALQGFNVVTWRRGGISYCAVSDVEADLLQQFVREIASG